MKFNVDVGSMAVVEKDDHYEISGDAFVYSQVANGFKFKPGSFTKYLESRGDGLGIPIFMNHNSDIVIGKWTVINDTKGKLTMQGELTKGVQAADEAALLLAHGAITGLSVGGSIDSHEYTDKFTIVEEFSIFECSLTAIPANRKALIKKLSNSDMDELSFKEIEATLRDAMGLSRKESKKWISNEKASETLSQDESEALALLLKTFTGD